MKLYKQGVSYTCLSLLIMLLFFNAAFCQEGFSVNIYPGKGIDSLILGKSTIKEARGFRGLKFSRRKVVVHPDNLDSHWTHTYLPVSRYIALSNDSMGLRFIFNYTMHFLFFKKYLFSRIIISKPVGVVNDIAIGRSNKKDVFAKFGYLDVGTMDEVNYNKLGVEFIFDNQGTLSRIELFLPTEK